MNFPPPPFLDFKAEQKNQGERRNSGLPPTILNTDKISVTPVQDVIPEVQKEMQKFSEKERTKINQVRQEKRSEKQAELMQFSENLKMPQSTATPPPSGSPVAPASAPAPAQAPAASPSEDSSPASKRKTPPEFFFPSFSLAHAALPKEFKMDPKAKEFKFNPGASTFVPGGAPQLTTPPPSAKNGNELGFAHFGPPPSHLSPFFSLQTSSRPKRGGKCRTERRQGPSKLRLPRVSVIVLPQYCINSYNSLIHYVAVALGGFSPEEFAWHVEPDQMGFYPVMPPEEYGYQPYPMMPVPPRFPMGPPFGQQYFPPPSEF